MILLLYQINGGSNMSRYESRISGKDVDGDFYALIVRVDYDGEETVINGFKGRYFKTRRRAILATTNYIKKFTREGV